MINVENWWKEKMSDDSPGMIFGLLQLLLGKQTRYEGADIYAGNQVGDDSHIET